MREVFRAYYRPTDSEFLKLWKDCLFVLDANILLNLYRYTPETRKALLDILQALSARLWVPHQSALEYHQNRLTVIEEQKAVYDSLCSFLRDTQAKIENEFRGVARHPSIKAVELLKAIQRAFKQTLDRLNKLRKAHPELLDHDEIRDTITTLLKGKVGLPYPRERLSGIYKDGKARYEERRPPGYLDAEKKSPRQYGDLVLWFQIIDKAKETKKPIILVTDDRKEDWWLTFKKKRIGPRPELLDEMLSDANVSFYMYTAAPFMEYAGKHLSRSVEKKAITEVQQVRERQEDLSAIAAAIAAEADSFSKAIQNYARHSEARSPVGLSNLAEEVMKQQAAAEAASKALYSSGGIPKVLKELMEQQAAAEAASKALYSSGGIPKVLKELMEQQAAAEAARQALYRVEGLPPREQVSPEVEDARSDRDVPSAGSKKAEK